MFQILGKAGYAQIFNASSAQLKIVAFAGAVKTPLAETSASKGMKSVYISFEQPCTLLDRSVVILIYKIL
jgi:hypothetical protein